MAPPRNSTPSPAGTPSIPPVQPEDGPAPEPEEMDRTNTQGASEPDWDLRYPPSPVPSLTSSATLTDETGPRTPTFDEQPTMPDRTDEGREWSTETVRYPSDDDNGSEKEEGEDKDEGQEDDDDKEEEEKDEKKDEEDNDDDDDEEEKDEEGKDGKDKDDDDDDNTHDGANEQGKDNDDDEGARDKRGGHPGTSNGESRQHSPPQPEGFQPGPSGLSLDHQDPFRFQHNEWDIQYPSPGTGWRYFYTATSTGRDAPANSTAGSLWWRYNGRDEKEEVAIDGVKYDASLDDPGDWSHFDPQTGIWLPGPFRGDTVLSGLHAPPAHLFTPGKWYFYWARPEPGRCSWWKYDGMAWYSLTAAQTAWVPYTPPRRRLLFAYGRVVRWCPCCWPDHSHDNYHDYDIIPGLAGGCASIDRREEQPQQQQQTLQELPHSRIIPCPYIDMEVRDGPFLLPEKDGPPPVSLPVDGLREIERSDLLSR